MRIDKLILKNFRNHEKLEKEFTTNTTLIRGANGTGKTNILEAVHMLSTGKPTRAQYDLDLICHEKNLASIRGYANINQEDFQLEVQLLRKEELGNRAVKKFKLNKLAKGMHTFIGTFNSVLFAPEDIQLLTRSPATRRNYMDVALSQVDSKYKKALSNYKKGVRQRNKLLEMWFDMPGAREQIGFWNNTILVAGIYIQGARHKLIDVLQTSIETHREKLEIGTKTLRLKYKINEISKERLGFVQQKEIAAKRTLVGPHLDDFEIYMDGHNVGHFGSRGQQRGTILALKLAETDYIEKIKAERPILLLDDIFSELDETHRKAILEILPLQQNIITTAEGHNFIESQQKLPIEVIDLQIFKTHRI
jgi:DNA replication and repair protein RecF